MKKIILATIPAITLGVAIAPEVNAEEKTMNQMLSLNLHRMPLSTNLSIQ